MARLIENLVAQICSPEEKGRIDVRSYHEYLSDLIGSLDLDEFLKTLGECTGHADAVQQLISRFPPHEVGRLFQALDELVVFGKFRDFLNDANHQGSEAAVRLWSFLSTNEINADPVHYLYEELELIRSAFPSLNRYAGYLEEYERPGRSIAFQRNRREQVLNLLHAWEHQQLQEGFLDHMGLGQSAAVAVEDRGGIPAIFRYRCVLVDEFQDFSTLDLELLQKIASATANGLFLTGDIAQKIYAKELNSRKAGMGPDKRIIRSIRKNYRNTRQILQAGGALMRAYPPAVDGDADLRMLDPELANRTSALPIAVKTDDPLREAWRQAKEWLAEGNPGFSVCIATANPDIFKVDEILARTPKGISSTRLTGDYLLDSSRVVVSDMAAIKGFEFSLIMILGLEDGVYPFAKRSEAEVWRDAMRLYVAITRGRDEVRFTYRDKPSRFLRAMDGFLDWREEVPFAIEDVPIQTKSVSYETEPGQLGETTKKDVNGVTIAEAGEQGKPVDTGLSPEVNVYGFRHKLTFLNGYPCLSIPRGLCQDQLAAILNANLTQLAVDIQAYDQHFVSPIAPLPDHIVRSVLGRCHIMVSFMDEQAPRQAAVRRKIT